VRNWRGKEGKEDLTKLKQSKETREKENGRSVKRKRNKTK
jgi:cell division protein FtsB